MSVNKTMTENVIFCPRCDSNQVVKNGLVHNSNATAEACDNQNFKGSDCVRQFGRNLKNKVISQETKDLIDKL